MYRAAALSVAAQVLLARTGTVSRHDIYPPERAMPLTALAVAPEYSPRRTTQTALYCVLEGHLENLIGQTESGGRELPAFVKKESRRHLTRGVLQAGFARLEGKICRCVAFITEKQTIRKILAAMDLPTETPRAAPARPSLQGQLSFE